MKKVFALLMVLALMLSAFAGCGTQSEETASSAPVEESAAVEVPPAEEPPPAEPASEASAAEESVVEEPVDDGKSDLIPEVNVVGEPGSISYPWLTGIPSSRSGTPCLTAPRPVWSPAVMNSTV